MAKKTKITTGQQELFDASRFDKKAPSQVSPEVTGVTTKRGTRQRKVHTGDTVSGDQMSRPSKWYDVDSSRVKKMRWDGGLGRIDVIFQDGTPWVYEVGGDYSVYHNFRRSASQGRYINRVLNQYPYRDAIGEFNGTEPPWNQAVPDPAHDFFDPEG